MWGKDLFPTKQMVCQVSSYKIVFEVLKDVPKGSVGPTSGQSSETGVCLPGGSEAGLSFPWKVFIWAAVQGELLELGP